MRHFAWCVLATGFWLTTSGCTLLHDLQPHRMWRWNRGPAPSANPFFSVSDPIPRLGEASDFPSTADAEATAQNAAAQ